MTGSRSPRATFVVSALQVCQFASIEVVDGMGTERQGIHKDMDFKRIDEDGNIIADYVWGEEKLV